ncbi:Glutathione transport system permease protein GsiD [bacterium HR23]|nr:Glutathione transport system permease protein GsiD [bacterium HR23]
MRSGRGEAVALTGVGRPQVAWSRWARWARQHPEGLVGGLVVLGFALLAVVAPLVVPYPPKATNFAPYLPPSGAHPLGTDPLGRDILSRALWGTRVAFLVGVLSVAGGVGVGGMLGMVLPFCGRLADMLTQRVVDILMGLPAVILALALMAILGGKVSTAIIAIAVVLVPASWRTVRSATLEVLARPYIEAARAVGCGPIRMVLFYLLPNVAPVFLILMSVNIGYAVVLEASLSFLGVGLPPDEPSWGSMIAGGVPVLERYPWVSLLPALVLSLFVLSINLVGDAIRDTLDPRLRGR